MSQEQQDKLKASGMCLHGNVPPCSICAEEKEPGEKIDSIWSGESEALTIENVDVVAPKEFAGAIFDFVKSMHLPKALYAGDIVAPVKPIDVYSVAAEELGVRSPKIIFKIEDVQYTDVSEDGEALIVCLSKYDITNPRMGLVGVISEQVRALIQNKGKVRADREFREQVRKQTADRVFGRALYGEAKGYQIPKEHEKAYYRGVTYDGLDEVARDGAFKGQNSDNLLAIIKPTIWAYTDPGMAESFGGKGQGVVLKFKKTAVDANYATQPGWQRWTVNEVMIQSKEDSDDLSVPVGEYVEEIVVFDEEGEATATRLFPDVPVIFLNNEKEGVAYLEKKGEITNEGLESYYDNPDKLAGYIDPADSNGELTAVGLERNMDYEQCHQAIKDKMNKIVIDLRAELDSDDQTLAIEKLIGAALRGRSLDILRPKVRAKIKGLSEQDKERLDGMYKIYTKLDRLAKGMKDVSVWIKEAEKFKNANQGL